MPELPEVERARRFLEFHLVRKKIIHVYAAEDTMVYRNTAPIDFKRYLEGATVLGVGRKGKYLWLKLDKTFCPVFHLGMTGNITLAETDQSAAKYEKVKMTTEDNVAVAMRDPRRFSRILGIHTPSAELMSYDPFSRLGEDPALNVISIQWLSEHLALKKSILKTLLLDQHFICGLGNWMVDEILYEARLSPYRKANTLTKSEVSQLADAIKWVTSTALSVNADSEQFPQAWLFHIRWLNRPRAKTARTLRDLKSIRFDKIGGRTTVWDPTRQI